MWNFLLKLICTVLFLIVLKKYHFLYILYRTFNRDFKALTRIFKAAFIGYQIRSKNKPIHYYFKKVLKTHPKKTAYLFEDETWTFLDVSDLANKIALFFEKEGYKKGDSIGLLLNNCPDYVAIWLGLSQIGVTVALMNTNLRNDSLLRSLKIGQCQAIIFGGNFGESITNCVNKCLDLKCYQYNRKLESTPVAHNCFDISKEISSIDPNEPLIHSYNVTSLDPLLYIYTSGTTGFPKAAIVNHMRVNMYQVASAAILPKPEDAIVYCPLPLYHGSGGIMGCGLAIMLGATVVIRSKFSGSNYWKDCVKYNCNTAQYIGEMCRYILHNCPEENIKHPVKLMFGNGLKPQIWKKFQEKYKIQQIYEFYGCTEGNFFLINIDNKVGSIGFMPPYLLKYSFLQLVKYSEVTGEPIRNAEGLCIKVKENEPGLAIGLIIKKKSGEPTSDYVGYSDPDETKRKVLEDVFKKGDKYYNSGDVFSYDEFGYYYFVDRLGDTFRWKGENVSTNEIEAVISNAIGLKDATAYGVEIPGTEGKAGMVSIVQEHTSLDMDQFLQHLKESLPTYAVPLFIRFKSSLSLTSTCKLQKYQLRSEGFNINAISDVIYFYNLALGKYVILTPTIYEDINSGKMRL